MTDTTTFNAPPVAPGGTLMTTRGKPSADTFKAYVDGSSLNNPGPAGWAVVLLEREAPGTPITRRALVGSEERATNNVMELEAATRALTALPLDARGTIWSDSTYVVDGANEWVPKWERNGWKKSKSKPVANVPEWLRLVAEWRRRPGVKFAWMRGHAGHRYNELADTLANAEAQKVRAGLPAVAGLEYDL
ncbi:ribonuclease HI [Aureimonas flava]|uniref:ribonuclease H n=1 Tax=Aureimonas flava TaxID=2320271 RepID=A0A3A1WIP1_9HYPH|nr:ribonuclease H [Aureimonas flava]RIX99523.1 ribonuclease HI [Aureimonas flava]